MEMFLLSDEISDTSIRVDEFYCESKIPIKMNELRVERPTTGNSRSPRYARPCNGK